MSLLDTIPGWPKHFLHAKTFSLALLILKNSVYIIRHCPEYSLDEEVFCKLRVSYVVHVHTYADGKSCVRYHASTTMVHARCDDTRALSTFADSTGCISLE